MLKTSRKMLYGIHQYSAQPVKVKVILSHANEQDISSVLFSNFILCPSLVASKTPKLVMEISFVNVTDVLRHG